MRSLGWTEEGRRLIQEAREKGICVSCGRRSKSKLPLGSARRRIACRPSCANEFYEQHYRSWATAKRAVLKRVRTRFAGAIRCERCGHPPREIERRQPVEWMKGVYFTTYRHPGYEFDHIVEVAAGGDTQDPANIQLLCLSCHKRKTARFLRRKTPSGLPPLMLPLETFSRVS